MLVLSCHKVTTTAHFFCSRCWLKHSDVCQFLQETVNTGLSRLVSGPLKMTLDTFRGER